MVNKKDRSRAVSQLLSSSLPPGAIIQIKMGEVAKEWNWVVGGNLARRSHPGSLEDGQLVVFADGPAVAQELKMRGAMIVARINGRWQTPISSIRVIVGRLKPLRRREKKVSRRRIIEPSERSVRANALFTNSVIEREDVAMALARLMATYQEHFAGKK